MATVAIIDYGMGNLHSIAKALEYVGGDTRVWVGLDPEKILCADRVVFPGVGGIGHCMDELRRLELDAVIGEVAATKPLLGVCLGLQALLEFSEENGGTNCLSILPGKVRRFPKASLDRPSSETLLKVPHMGWNQVHQEVTHPLWKNIPQDSRFYFVHSYYADPANPENQVGTTFYGAGFAAALAKDNIFAVQCHPEKSQQSGLTLLSNFLEWDGQA